MAAYTTIRNMAPHRISRRKPRCRKILWISVLVFVLYMFMFIYRKIKLQMQPLHETVAAEYEPFAFFDVLIFR
jgi:hypothetical protein